MFIFSYLNKYIKTGSITCCFTNCFVKFRTISFIILKKICYIEKKSPGNITIYQSRSLII